MEVAIVYQAHEAKALAAAVDFVLHVTKPELELKMAELESLREFTPESDRIRTVSDEVHMLVEEMALPLVR